MSTDKPFLITIGAIEDRSACNNHSHRTTDNPIILSKATMINRMQLAEEMAMLGTLIRSRPWDVTSHTSAKNPKRVKARAARKLKKLRRKQGKQI